MDKTFSIKHYIKASNYAIKGLCTIFKREPAFRLELLILVILTPIALWVGHGEIQRALLIGSIFLVLIVELINSALETVVNRIGLEKNMLFFINNFFKPII